ncbi:MAG: two component, sigma54 specific, transcriptional regulator, Fis family [Parcubacteria group bacterium]|nr:two component, sigma54 specific, transcriptional regulator, Fis family [Parcubacteria group bacterium]
MSDSPEGVLQLLDAHGELRSMDDLEYEIIQFAITKSQGNMSETAWGLKIGRSTLYRKMNEKKFRRPAPEG